MARQRMTHERHFEAVASLVTRWRRSTSVLLSWPSTLSIKGAVWIRQEVLMSALATDRVTVIKPGQTYVGKQGFTYGAGASAETVGAKHICMNVLPMPPGARAK